MSKETRTVQFDADLKIEVYHFQGIMQKFPNHFHEYYVIGFIESGCRYLSCKNEEYTVRPGDLVLFNPKDNHECEQIDGKTLDYRCINIQPERMKEIVFEITGKAYLPHFEKPVLFHTELAASLKELHAMLLEGENGFCKEESFFFLLEQLIFEHAKQEGNALKAEGSSQVEKICTFIEENYMKNITLDELGALTGLSKFYMIRLFTKEKGISPYSYLETIRIERAKKMLEEGVAPAEAAFLTGFSDQSHFSNFFKRLIGLTPKQYQNIFKNF